MTNELYNLLNSMCHSALNRYIVPTLTSEMVGGSGKGNVRLFTNDGCQPSHILPHTHRYDFVCIVLKGWVDQTVLTPIASVPRESTSPYQVSLLCYEGEPGEYTKTEGDRFYFRGERTRYVEGEQYSLSSTEYHTVEFSDNAVVLFLEGPSKREDTCILEPMAPDGSIIQEFKVSPWMFKS